METLYSKTGGKIPIWAIGHAGHDVAGQEHSIPSRLGKKNLRVEDWIIIVAVERLCYFILEP
jgi:hypothetical protein